MSFFNDSRNSSLCHLLFLFATQDGTDRKLAINSCNQIVMILQWSLDHKTPMFKRPPVLLDHFSNAPIVYFNLC